MGREVTYTTIDDMLVHIWSNYDNTIYNLYNV